MAKADLTPERLREVLHYDQEAGLFRWLKPTGKKAVVGNTPGWVDGDGYLMMSVDGRRYRAHRLAWMYVHGALPEADIDHKNGVRLDNRLDNLRSVSRSVNMQNQRAPRGKTVSGFLGVYLHKASGLWHACIKANGKKHSLGYYKAPEDGHEAYLAAKRRLHEGCTI